MKTVFLAPWPKVKLDDVNLLKAIPLVQAVTFWGAFNIYRYT